MFSGHQTLQSPTLGSRIGKGETGVPSGQMDASQLKARLYGTAEVHNNTRSQLKVSRRRSKTSEVCRAFFYYIPLVIPLSSHVEFSSSSKTAQIRTIGKQNLFNVIVGINLFLCAP